MQNNVLHAAQRHRTRNYHSPANQPTDRQTGSQTYRQSN